MFVLIHDLKYRPGIQKRVISSEPEKPILAHMFFLGAVIGIWKLICCPSGENNIFSHIFFLIGQLLRTMIQDGRDELLLSSFHLFVCFLKLSSSSCFFYVCVWSTVSYSSFSIFYFPIVLHLLGFVNVCIFSLSLSPPLSLSLSLSLSLPLFVMRYKTKRSRQTNRIPFQRFLPDE